ncbi:MAG: hypothetical protein HWE27_12290 [Gammaproteobacteria bacterium]|nr:hypothetical protein [Gammaproteobacteria bacterium]
MTNWIILKFGGSSVADPNLWQTIKAQVELQQALGKRPVLVLSALKNVSNLLEALLHQALSGVHETAITHLRELHSTFASQIGLDGNRLLEPWFEQLAAFCDDIYQQEQISPASHAKVVALGELMSSTLGAAYLQQHNLPANWCDIREVLLANNSMDDPWHHFTSNQCGYSEDSDLQSQWSQTEDIVVTQGFIARDELNQTVLLGREGSDTSACYLGAKLAAEKIEIWTDVPGVFTFNPRINADALQISYLDYRQATVLATAGAKVIHPRALQPAHSKHIPIIIKSTALPDNPGSIISTDKGDTQEALAMAIESNLVQVIAQEQSVVDKILIPAGFDRVNLFKDTTLGGLYLYTNTEMKQPDVESLLTSLGKVEVRYQQSLITILGSTTNDHWINETVEHVKYQWFDKINSYQILPADGLIGFLIDDAFANQMCEQLHNGLIEHQVNDSCYGLSWREFI